MTQRARGAHKEGEGEEGYTMSGARGFERQLIFRSRVMTFSTGNGNAGSIIFTRRHEGTRKPSKLLIMSMET